MDPDLKPMKQQEATFGLEHQLNDVIALSVRYVHKQIDRAIEDTGALDPSGTEIYIIANPGEGPRRHRARGFRITVAQPEAGSRLRQRRVRG